jgi:hypothetical protein
MKRAVIVFAAFVAGCGSDEPAPRDESPQVAAPDAGMAAGHQNEPRRVTVPRSDASAPQAVLELGGVEAVSGGRAPEPVRLEAPLLEPTAIGRDKQGMTRIRVSLEAKLRCGDETMPLVRYFPPPETARPRVPPGTLAPTELSREVRFALSCPRGKPSSAEGTLWADATSAWETEASSAPIRFTYHP